MLIRITNIGSDTHIYFDHIYDLQFYVSVLLSQLIIFPGLCLICTCRNINFAEFTSVFILRYPLSSKFTHKTITQTKVTSSQRPIEPGSANQFQSIKEPAPVPFKL
jgi:hypothetical protein